MTTKRGEGQARQQSPFRGPTFWLALITAASLAVGVLSVVLAYLALKQPEPGLTFETVGDTNVLDVRRPLQDLSIVFRGQEVQEQNLNLRIITINVINSGQLDILPSHYDQEDDWGVRFQDGEVVEARLVDTNSDYLRSRVIPQRLGVDTVAFPKVIFEKDAFFAVEVLLLHPKSVSPSVSSIGKIAGIDEITVLTRPLAREEVSFIRELFQGSPFIQVVRAIVYLGGSLLGIVVTVLGLVLVTEVVGNLRAKRRRRRILQSGTIHQIHQDEVRNLLVRRYELNGIAGLRELQGSIGEAGRIEWVAPLAKWIVRGRDDTKWNKAGGAFEFEFMRPSFQQELDTLATTGILERGEDDEPVVDKAFKETVDRLLAELEL